MSEIAVWLARPDDAKAIAVMIEEIEKYYGSTTIQPFEERLTQTGTVLFGKAPMAYALLASHEGETVGIATYSFLWPAAGSTHSLFLKELFVRPAARRLKVGKRLMREIRSIAQKQPGCSRIEWTADQNNDDARKFYRSLGFEEFDGKVIYRVTS